MKKLRERKPLSLRQICILMLVALLIVGIILCFFVPHYAVFGKMYIGDFSSVYGFPSCIIGDYDRFCLTTDGRMLLPIYVSGKEPEKIEEVPMTRIFLTPLNFDIYFEKAGKRQWLSDTNPAEIRNNTVAAWSGRYVPEEMKGEGYYQYYVLQQKNGLIYVTISVFYTNTEENTQWPRYIQCGVFRQEASADSFYALCEKGYYKWDK